jgi:hypothetical protein
MASRPLKIAEEEKDVPAPMLGPPTDERREWLTLLLAATEKALAASHSTSQAFGTTAKDLADLRDRLQAELATLRRDEWAGRLLPPTS